MEEIQRTAKRQNSSEKCNAAGFEMKEGAASQGIWDVVISKDWPDPDREGTDHLEPEDQGSTLHPPSRELCDLRQASAPLCACSCLAGTRMR